MAWRELWLGPLEQQKITEAVRTLYMPVYIYILFVFIYIYTYSLHSMMSFYVYERKACKFDIKCQYIKSTFAMRCWLCFGTSAPMWILDWSHKLAKPRNRACFIPSRHDAMIWLAIVVNTLHFLVRVCFGMSQYSADCEQLTSCI